MFKLRKKQQDGVAMKRFVDRLEVFVAEDMLQRKTTPEERRRRFYREMIEHGIEVARGFGFVGERDLMFFVLNMITINPEFHRHPRIEAILRDGTLGGPERREKLLTDVSDDEWEEAAEMTDADAYWARVLPAN